MVLGHNSGSIVVVESELDGILLKQEVGDLTDIVALGSAQARPDTETTERLRKATIILVALDSDDAGSREAQWWLRQFPNGKRWPIVEGKDPAEALQKGFDLKTWIEAGLQEGST